MSDSMDMIVEMLPLSSKLQQEDNPLRIVLDRTVGEWLDNFSQPYEQLFLMSATGGWLDAHGRDYGIPRKIDEDDESYRQRIVYEKLDHLTPSLLSDVYNVKLFTYHGDFNVSDNTLVSDNPHIVQNESFLGTVDEDTIRILDKKFILDSVVTWINDTGELEYLLDTRGKNILSGYSKIYKLTNLSLYFKYNSNINKVKLVLSNVINCERMFISCENLIDVDLDLPNVTNCFTMFGSCRSLVNIDLNLPSATNCNQMFYICKSLVNVDLTLPNADDCSIMFRKCSSLVNVDLDLPNATNCNQMFEECSSLVNVKLNLPKLSSYNRMFYLANKIKTIDVTIPTSLVSGFKSYVTGLNLQHLTSFKINGEEQL